MRSVVLKSLYILIFAASCAGLCSASPLSSQLLPLVPPGSDVVAGFESRSGLGQAHLLLATRNNRLDLADWQALTGVDSQRVCEEVIEVAASDSAGSLSEHLLLVAGRFNHERIFHSFEENGVPSTDFQGRQIWVIQPFARERGDMLDARWLVVLENHIGLFGTPDMVRRALKRYEDHSLPDSVLEERLSLLRSDVTSWNMLSRSSTTGRAFTFAQPDSAWAELQENTDLLAVGARFGSKIRIDFSIQTKTERGAEFFAGKASFFTGAIVAGPNQETVPAAELHRRTERFTIGANHIEGSVELSVRQFEAWCEEISRLRMPAGALAARGK